MNRTEHKMLLDLHRKQTEALQAINTGCRGCAQYQPGPICRLYDDAIPNDAVQVGCDAWEYDEIPF